MRNDHCIFCQINEGKMEAFKVYEDEETLIFLDHRPLFLGHCLLIPKQHVETLIELPSNSLQPFFSKLQEASKVVEFGMQAQGTFIAMNNKVSQSVPHLHAHIVPRRKGDGLKGFFWPRYKATPEELQMTAETLKATWETLYLIQQ